MSGDDSDQRFMREAIELARRVSFTSPNPRVGAVFVRDGLVIARGAHEGPGRPHAEAQALRGTDVSGSTLYVNLEPCVHRGRTPPCAPALVDAGVTRVVAAVEDPDERVSGRGLAALRDGGVDVVTGVLAAEATRLNAAYLHHRTTGRAFVSLKLAMTLDGRLGARDGSSRWITGPEARRRVHERRAEVDAVMVGSGTVSADDPRLTARHPGATRQPARIVVDGSGTTSPSARVLAGTGVTFVATTNRSSHDVHMGWKDAGAEVIVLPEADDGVDLRALVEHLGAAGMLEVLCEGGARLATSLLRADLVSRLELHLGPVLVGPGGAALGHLGVQSMGDARRWTRVSSEGCDGDTIVVLEPKTAH
ncbi:bifunctional diaminohydroxyphosphoribosylaminopyrimidine deaminase/5-amino-6-(5-phosphoribosylamino)uracil reductase RibD [soil metagenome]